MIDKDHERLTEIWKGSVLKQPGLPSDYLVRLRELMLAFGTRSQSTWPLMYFLEKHPLAFKAWHTSRKLISRATRKHKKPTWMKA